MFLVWIDDNMKKKHKGIVVARASALQWVDLGFISQVESYQKTLKMKFTSSLLGAQHKRDSAGNKPASLLVASLDKALNGMPPSLCGRQVVGPSSLPAVAVRSSRRLANIVRVLTQCNEGVLEIEAMEANIKGFTKFERNIKKAF